MIWFRVSRQMDAGDIIVLCLAKDREDAKMKSLLILRGDPDQYTVSPITNPGQTVVLAGGPVVMSELGEVGWPST
jgi:hypothetical protein